MELDSNKKTKKPHACQQEEDQVKYFGVYRFKKFYVLGLSTYLSKSKLGVLL